jgi:HEAT repeat protein
VKEPPAVQNLSLKQAAIEVLADIGTEKSVPGLRKVLATTDFHEASRLRKPAQDALDAIAARKKKK